MRRNTVAIGGGRTGRAIEPIIPPDSDESKQARGGSLQGPLHVLAEMMHLGLGLLLEKSLVPAGPAFAVASPGRMGDHLVGEMVVELSILKRCEDKGNSDTRGYIA